MSAYIQWLAPKIEALKSDLPERLRELRADARRHITNHDRTPDILASLALGLETFLRFARDVHAISADQEAAFRDQCWQSLLLAAETQAGHQANAHKTSAPEEVHVLKFEPKSIVNTGNVRNERTTTHEPSI